MIFGIKIALKEQYDKCVEYLNKHNVKILQGTLLFYIETDEIKAVAGYHQDLGGAIEPLVSENAVYTKTLGIFMYGFLIGKGYSHISCWTENKVWKEILTQLGFTVCSESTTRLVKEII